MTRPSPVSLATRAKWSRQWAFIHVHGSRYLSERERVFIADVSRQIAAGSDLSFDDSRELGRIHAQMQERIG